MAMENESSPDNEDECLKKRYNRKSFEVRQKQSLLSDSDDDNKEDSEHCIIGEKRSIGRSQWVQCDNPECQKWRRIDYVIDIDEVESAKWVCEMNKDEKKSACEASQETIGTEDEDDPCTTDHKPGMVLLGKVPGYPWWPCMVDNDPDIETFYWNEADESSSEQKTSIHVTFFGKQCTRAWLYPHFLRDLTGKENIKDMGSMKFRGTNFKNDVTDAFNDAKQSLMLSVKERISKYGFTVRYDGKEYAGNPEEKSEEPRKSIISKRKTMKQHMKRTGDKETGNKGTGNKGTRNKETGNKETRNKDAGNKETGSMEKKSKKPKRDLSKKQKSSEDKKADKLEMCKHRGIAKLSKTQERIKKKLKGLKNLKMKDRCPRSVGHINQDMDKATNETEVVPDVYTESDDGMIHHEESCPVTLPKSPKDCRNSGLLDACNEGDSMNCEKGDKGLMKSVEIREGQSKTSPAKRKIASWQLTREEINSVPSLVKPTLVPIDEKLISERAEKMMKKAKKNLNNGDNIDIGDEASCKEGSQDTDECQRKKAVKIPASKGNGKKQSSGKQAEAKPVVHVAEHEGKLDRLEKTGKQGLVECQKDVEAKAKTSAINNKKKKHTKEKKKNRPIKKHSKNDEKSNDEAAKLVGAAETDAKENNSSGRRTENKAAGSRSKSKEGNSTVESTSEESKRKRKDENKDAKKKQKENSGKQHEKIKRNISKKKEDMYEIKDMNYNEMVGLSKSLIDGDSKVEDNEVRDDAKTSKTVNASTEIKKNLKGNVKPGKKSTFAVPRKKSSNQENKDRYLESISSTLKRKQNPCKNGWDSINEMTEDSEEKARKMKYRGTQCVTAMADAASEVDDLDLDTFKTNTRASLVAISKSASKNKAKNAKNGEEIAVSYGIGKAPNHECSEGTEPSSQDIISFQEATDIISEAFLNDSSSISNAVEDHVDESIMPSNRRKKGTFMQISPLLPDNADEDLRLSPILKSTYQDAYSRKGASNFSHDLMDSVVPVNNKYADESDDSPEF